MGYDIWYYVGAVNRAYWFIPEWLQFMYRMHSIVLNCSCHPRDVNFGMCSLGCAGYLGLILPRMTIWPLCYIVWFGSCDCMSRDVCVLYISEVRHVRGVQFARAWNRGAVLSGRFVILFWSLLGTEERSKWYLIMQYFVWVRASVAVVFVISVKNWSVIVYSSFLLFLICFLSFIVHSHLQHMLYLYIHGLGTSIVNI